METSSWVGADRYIINEPTHSPNGQYPDVSCSSNSASLPPKREQYTLTTLYFCVQKLFTECSLGNLEYPSESLSQKLPNQCHSAKFWMNHLVLDHAKLATPLSPFHHKRIIHVGYYSNQHALLLRQTTDACIRQSLQKLRRRHHLLGCACDCFHLRFRPHYVPGQPTAALMLTYDDLLLQASFKTRIFRI